MVDLYGRAKTQTFTSGWPLDVCGKDLDFNPAILVDPYFCRDLFRLKKVNIYAAIYGIFLI